MKKPNICEAILFSLIAGASIIFAGYNIIKDRNSINSKKYYCIKTADISYMCVNKYKETNNSIEFNYNNQHYKFVGNYQIERNK